MTAVALIAVKLAVAVLIMAIGMGSSFVDVTYLLRRPALLLRSLGAMYVLVPLVTVLMVAFLPLNTGVKAALMVLAVSAGAPLLPRKLQQFGDGAYGFSLVVVSSVVAIVVTPLWVALLARHFGVSAELSWRDAALAIGTAFLAPLMVGMALGAYFPRLAADYAERLSAAAALVLTTAGVVLLAVNWHILVEVRLTGMLALLGVMIMALVIGHICGGPKEMDRTTLAIACATRHIGIAVIVATAFRGPRTIVILAAYVVASALVSIPYLRWRRGSPRVAKSGEPA
ncbi:hypothetical protein [Ancylobacter mangrovi]|uniref:hypothetical protein n=1 Tax=Ancylobacter mangrovi TaxID=2972472 RepID=UPI002161ED3F|nr:hypothetical protein [Ancylobacter mangrovi]MCS0502936.1 hypothetical protein [Ancylobacter mangrovi]